MTDEFPKQIRCHQVFLNDLGDFECEDCGGVAPTPEYFENYICGLFTNEARRLKLTPVVRNRENEDELTAPHR